MSTQTHIYNRHTHTNWSWWLQYYRDSALLPRLYEPYEPQSPTDLQIIAMLLRIATIQHIMHKHTRHLLFFLLNEHNRVTLSGVVVL